jgi:adenylate kinase family enzyme
VVRRILIFGQSGAGKSTFAAELARRTGLPLYHVDLLTSAAGLAERRTEVRRRLDEIQRGESWIIDGWVGLLKKHAKAEVLILLEAPLYLRLLRVLRRGLGSTGVGHPVPSFFGLLLHLRRIAMNDRQRQRRLERLLRNSGRLTEVIRLGSRGEVAAWLDQFGAPAVRPSAGHPDPAAR